MYPSGIRFLAIGVGLPSMTPEGYDSVIDKIVPSALQLKKDGANAISIMGTSLTFYKGAAFNQQLQDAVKKATGLPATTHEQWTSSKVCARRERSRSRSLRRTTRR